MFFFFFFCFVLFCHYYYSANLQIQHNLLSLLSFSYFITPYDAQASSAFSALIPITVRCSIVFPKSEDLGTLPNHLNFHFLNRVRSSFYSPMAAWIFLRTSSLVTWPLAELLNYFFEIELSLIFYFE